MTPAPADRRRHVLASAGLVAFTVVMVVDVVVQLAARRGSTADAVGGLMLVAVITMFPVSGWVILRRRPRNRIGWLLLAIGLAWAVGGISDAYMRYALVLAPGTLPGGLAAHAVNGASWLPPIALTGTFLILLYPDGRLPSRRWRPLAWATAAVVVIGVLGILLQPGPLEDAPGAGRLNPLGIAGLEPVLRILQFVIPLFPLCILGSAIALGLRFRRARGVERLQLKWFVAAGAAVAVTFVVSVAGSLPTMFTRNPPPQAVWVTVFQNLSLASLALIPVAIGVAITRHGLYGIDRIINRALVIGALGVFVTGVYVAVVVGLGSLIGQQHPSVLLSVAATAAVAVAFQPVRERVQRLANRLVYGRRATPYEVLSDLASRMAGTYTTAELLPQLARLVGQSLGGATTEVRVRDGDRYERRAAWPAPDGTGADGAEPDRVVPVRHQGEELGRLYVTKPAGEPLTPPEDALLAHVASQAGLVLRNVALADGLRRSGERLVAAHDVECRRLERALHDGAQQTLVTVAMHLRAAQEVTGADPDGVAPMTAEAAAQLGIAVGELRELARGLHPTVLTERGLGPAVTSLAERSPVPVVVEPAAGEPVGRLTPTVEATLYFVVAEALTNVAKYASATSAHVRLTRTGETVTASVTDDGTGGADPARGSGLRGLADRVALAGGTLDVDSPPGGGTRVTCRVPAVRSAARSPESQEPDRSELETVA